MPNITILEQKKKLFDMITPHDLKTIHRRNPLKVERNEKIYELYQKGFSTKLLSNVTGLTQTSISNIGQHGHNYQNIQKSRRKKELVIISEVEDAFNAFSIRLGQILKCKR